MKKIFLRFAALIGIIIALNACVGKSRYECYFPPQTMRFCIIDSTLNPPASWINNNNRDSLYLYSVKEGVLTPISFYLDTLHFPYPVVMSSTMSSLAGDDDSTKRITEFRLYDSKNTQSTYKTVTVNIKKTHVEDCFFYVYESTYLNGHKMKLDTTSSYWVGSIKLY